MVVGGGKLVLRVVTFYCLFVFPGAFMVQNVQGWEDISSRGGLTQDDDAPESTTMFGILPVMVASRNCAALSFGGNLFGAVSCSHVCGCSGLWLSLEQFTFWFGCSLIFEITIYLAGCCCCNINDGVLG